MLLYSHWKVEGANIISLRRSIMSKTLRVCNELPEAPLPRVAKFDPVRQIVHFCHCRLLTYHISFIIHRFDVAVFGVYFLKLIIASEQSMSRLDCLRSITAAMSCFPHVCEQKSLDTDTVNTAPPLKPPTVRVHRSLRC